MGELIMTLFVGCVSVFIKIYFLSPEQLTTPGVLHSSQSSFSTPWQGDSFCWRKAWTKPGYRGSPISSWVQIKPFSLCGNEELRLCVRVICWWPPPISLLTWQSPGPLLNLDVFSCLFPPPCSALGGNKKKNKNKETESTPSSHPNERR